MNEKQIIAKVEIQTRKYVDDAIAQIRKENDQDDNRDSNRKIVLHLTVITLGVALAVGLTHLPWLGWFAIPVGTLPSIAVEVIDRIFGL